MDRNDSGGVGVPLAGGFSDPGERSPYAGSGEDQGRCERGLTSRAAVLEALLFAAPKPLTLQEIRKALQGAMEDEAADLEEADQRDGEGASVAADPLVAELAGFSVDDLRMELEVLGRAYRADADRGFHLVEVADGYQLASKREVARWLRPLLEDRRKNLLTRASLETLSVIAYRQPVTRADVEDVRGVSVDGVIRSLLEKGLIRIRGKSDLPGRPMLYETGPLFLEHFGLRSVEDLPAYGELSRVPIRSGGKKAEWFGDDDAPGAEVGAGAGALSEAGDEGAARQDGLEMDGAVSQGLGEESDRPDLEDKEENEQ